MSTRAALLLLVDGRLPAGGHAHSAGVEEFVRRGELRDVAGLRSFLETRLETTGIVEGALAAAAGMRVASWDLIDAEAAARLVSPAIRATSRALGRQLVRIAARLWPHDVFEAVTAVHREGPHHAVAIGAAAGAAGLEPTDAAVAALYGAIATPATAAVRLLGLDPVATHGIIAALAPRVDAHAAEIVGRLAADGLAAAPAPSALRSEMAAEEHAQQEVRLFAS